MRELPNPLLSISLLGENFAGNIKSNIHQKFSQMLPNQISSKFKNKPLSEVIQHPEIQAPVSKKNAGRIQVSWASNEDEVKEAQRLRYKVFCEEMGARLPAHPENLDVDIFDKYCDHLLVRDQETLKVIGTYRVMPPHQAKLMGCLYSDSEFDLVRLNHLRHKIVEVGRSCVHQDYRSGGVIMALWGGLGKYMQEHGYEIMLGCASVPMADGGHYAASLNRMIQEQHLSPIEYRAFPRLALPLEALNSTLEIDAPPLIKGYMRIGAKICGDPAWDPDFNTADFLTILRLSDINQRYAKHFL